MNFINELHCQGAILKELEKVGGQELVNRFKSFL